MINETYSAFVQGFMPSLPRPDVDVLDGLTTAIIVDQERMGANPRSTVGTATDTYTMLRVLYSRIGQPHVGPPTAFAFNVPTSRAGGVMSTEKAGRVEKKVVKDAVYLGGMCPRCEGTGSVSDFDLSALYDETRSLSEEALLVPGYSMSGWYGRIFTGAGFDLDKPIGKYSKREREKLLYGLPEKIKVEGVNLTYEGLIPKIQKTMLAKDVEAMQPHVRRFVERAITFDVCPECEGTRLNASARSAKIAGVSIAEATTMQITDLAEWVRSLDEPTVAPLLEALLDTLDSFVQIGLGYLSLNRPAGSLSGGEAQRTRMIRHLGSSLTDVTYVFDEPTIGLHPHDIDRMNQLLLQLRDKGNTVLVVEHKPETIAIADHVIDLGPRAGTHGGENTFAGSFEELKASDTVTGKHLGVRVPVKDEVSKASDVLAIRGASRNNLDNVDVDIPLGVLSAITGVAGSGKSSLMACLPQDLVDSGRILFVDQSAIRGSRRSNPATYTGALDSIRKAFAKAHGVKPGLFSANSDGACPHCNGAGVVWVDLGLMSGVDVPCEVCEGRRFNDEVLGYELAEIGRASCRERGELW